VRFVSSNNLSTNTSYAVFDLETGGLDASTDPILQIAVVTFGLAGNETIGEGSWSSMVRLPRPWTSYGAKHIHGIRRHRLLFAPTLAQSLARFTEICGDRTLVAHNFDFDWGFLTIAAERMHLPLPRGPHLCTLRLSRSLDPKRQYSHRLSDVAQRYGIANDHEHDALADAKTTAAVLPHLMRETPS
jgi:DNA polymerase III epsilon subunit-like protein